MAPNIKNVLVIGNQHLSACIIGSLTHADQDYSITLLTSAGQTPFLPAHQDHHHHSRPHKELVHLTTDFTPSSLEKAFRNQDIIISTISGGDYALQTRIIEAAIAAGVQRFIPHEFAQDSLNEGIRERLPPYRERWRVIECLRRKQKEQRQQKKASSAEIDRDSIATNCHLRKGTSETNGHYEEKDGTIEWLALATGMTLDLALLNENLGFSLPWHSATIPGTGNESFACSSLTHVGNVVAHAIRNWEALKNQYVYAAGFVTTGNEVVRCLEDVMRKSWTVGYVDVEDLAKEGRKRLEGGWLEKGMWLVERSVLFDERLGAVRGFEKEGKEGLMRLGLEGEAEDVSVVVERAVREFAGKNRGGDCGCG